MRWTWILELLFGGCSHNRTTFPLTTGKRPEKKATYCVCLDCGRSFEYSWKEMRMGKEIECL